MDMGRFLIETHLRTGRPIKELAAAHGLSASWLFKLLRRYRLEGPEGLESRSRRPHRSPIRIADLFEDEIVALHKGLADDGLGAGADQSSRYPSISLRPTGQHGRRLPNRLVLRRPDTRLPGGIGAGSSGKEGLDPRRVERTGVQESLATVALLTLELIELGLFLDSLGQGLDPERLAQLDEGVDQLV